MSPSPNRQAVVVGLFASVAVVILAGGILTIGDINDTFTRKITASAIFEGVNGLQRGDNVWFSGMKVGVVQGLRFHDGYRVEVDLRIDKEAAEVIHSDALVKIGSDGLIGNRIMVIYGGTDQAPLLQHQNRLEVGTTVTSEDIMTVLQENNHNLLAITADMRAILSGVQEGQGTVGRLVKEEQLYTELSDTVAGLHLATDRAGAITASVSAFTAKLNQEGNLPHDLVTDHTIYPSLTSTVSRLQGTGNRASELVDGLAAGAADLHSPVGMLLHDETVGRDVKAALDNLNRSSVLLEQNLAALQHNFLLRGYFRKQEKLKKKAEKERKQAEKAGVDRSDPSP